MYSYYLSKADNWIFFLRINKVLLYCTLCRVAGTLLYAAHWIPVIAVNFGFISVLDSNALEIPMKHAYLSPNEDRFPFAKSFTFCCAAVPEIIHHKPPGAAVSSWKQVALPSRRMERAIRGDKRHHQPPTRDVTPPIKPCSRHISAPSENSL